MKTPLINRRFFSAEYRMQLPTGWQQLTDKQLIYYAFLSTAYPPDIVKALFLIRLLDIKVLKSVGNSWLCLIKGRKVTIESWELMAGLQQLAWLDNQVAARPSEYGGFHAVHRLLQEGFTFFDYLRCETFFQQFIITENFGNVVRMANFLYRDADGKNATFRTLDETGRAIVILWWIGIKDFLAKTFSDLFTRPAEGDAPAEPQTPQSLMEANDAQIRALTGGDITKENDVLAQPCWRALSELNAKAREAKELKKLYSK